MCASMNFEPYLATLTKIVIIIIIIITIIIIIFASSRPSCLHIGVIYSSYESLENGAEIKTRRGNFPHSKFARTRSIARQIAINKCTF